MPNQSQHKQMSRLTRTHTCARCAPPEQRWFGSLLTCARDGTRAHAFKVIAGTPPQQHQQHCVVLAAADAVGGGGGGVSVRHSQKLGPPDGHFGTATTTSSVPASALARAHARTLSPDGSIVFQHVVLVARGRTHIARQNICICIYK